MRRTHDGLSPNLPVQASVLDGFGDVFGLEGFSAGKVGKGAGDFWDAVVSTGAVAGVLILRQGGRCHQDGWGTFIYFAGTA